MLQRVRENARGLLRRVEAHRVLRFDVIHEELRPPLSEPRRTEPRVRAVPSDAVPPLYWITVTLHLPSAILWLGGMLFLGAVGSPGGIPDVLPPSTGCGRGRGRRRVA